MTFKPLEFQMAIPRTQEFSGMQQQAAQRPIVEQNILANQSSKQTEEQRNQNAELEQSSKSQLRAGQENAQGQGKGNRSKKAPSASEEEGNGEEVVHPYKGHHLDIKL